MCNGWANRETWLVNLWFGDHFAEMQANGEAVTAEYIREAVEQYVDDNLDPLKCHGFIRDMLDLNAINYDELASHYETEPELVED